MLTAHTPSQPWRRTPTAILRDLRQTSPTRSTHGCDRRSYSIGIALRRNPVYVGHDHRDRHRHPRLGREVGGDLRWHRKILGAATQIGTSNDGCSTATGLAPTARTLSPLWRRTTRATSLRAASSICVQPTAVNSIAKRHRTADPVYVRHDHRERHQHRKHGEDRWISRRHERWGPRDASGGIWTYNATGLGDGTHTFTAVATDNAGNTSSPSQPSPTRSTRLRLLSAPSSIGNLVRPADTDTIYRDRQRRQPPAWLRWISTTTVQNRKRIEAAPRQHMYVPMQPASLPARTPSPLWRLTPQAMRRRWRPRRLSPTWSSHPAHPHHSTASGQTPGYVGRDTIWTATANPDTITVTATPSLQLQDGGDLRRRGLLATRPRRVDANGNGTYTYTATVSRGAHTFAAVVTDNEGDTSTLASSPTAIDLSSQRRHQASINAATSTQTSPTNSTSDFITVNASAGAKSVEIYDGTKDVAPATWDSLNNDWTYNATGLADGTHTFGAVAKDNVGIGRPWRLHKPPSIMSTAPRRSSANWLNRYRAAGTSTRRISSP